MDRMRLSWLVLVALLAIQAAIALPPPPRPYAGDEPYYMDKARQIARGRIDRATPEELAISRGEIWGTADWRPPGYPTFLALAGAGHLDFVALRRRVAAIQFAAIATVLLAIFALFGRRAPLPAAILLGIAPGALEFLTVLYPDPLTATLMFFGILLMWRAIVSRRALLMFAGALLTSAGFLLRPEMIVVSAAMIALVFLFVRFRPALCAAAAAAFLLVCAVQYAYRIQLTGERFPTFFGGFRTESLGAYHWVNGRLLTEHEGLEDIVYTMAGGGEPRIPERVIADAREREEIDRALAILRRDHRNSAAVDLTFERLAKEHARNEPVHGWLVPRVAHIGQLWINLSTNAQTLATLSRVPRSLRLPLLALLFAVKCAAVALFCMAIVALIRERRARDERWTLIALFAAFVIVRTLLIGSAINTMEHRYVTTAWPALLACACAAMPARQAILGRGVERS